MSLFNLPLEQRIPLAMFGTIGRTLCHHHERFSRTNYQSQTHERVSARELQMSIRCCKVQLYVAGVTPTLQVLGWTGTAIFSVARLFHLAEKLEQLGLIRDVSSHQILATRRRKVQLDVACVTPAKTSFCYVICFVTSASEVRLCCREQSFH